MEIEILNSLKNDGPQSGRQLATRFGRGQGTVGAACQVLRRQGRIQRSGKRWHFVRMTVPASKFRFAWTIESARAQVVAFAASPQSAGRWAREEPREIPRSLPEAFAAAAREARLFLESKDPEWLEAYDIDLTNMANLRQAIDEAPHLLDKFLDRIEEEQSNG